jgi:hypothetical protein
VPEGQVNFILPEGDTVTFDAGVSGGAIWEYPGCSFKNVIADVNGNSGFSIYHLEEGDLIEGPPQ